MSEKCPIDETKHERFEVGTETDQVGVYDIDNVSTSLNSLWNEIQAQMRCVSYAGEFYEPPVSKRIIPTGFHDRPA